MESSVPSCCPADHAMKRIGSVVGRRPAILRAMMPVREGTPPGGNHDMNEETIQTATGLEYIEIAEGTGAQPKPGDSVSVHYTGWLKSGQKFDSSHDRGQPLVFPLGRGRV